MRKIFLVFCTTIQLFTCSEVHAQSSAEDYLVEIKKLLNLKDCNGASNAYDNYKQLSGMENETIQNAIIECLTEEMIRLSNSYEGSKPSQEEISTFLQEFENSYEKYLAEMGEEQNSYIDLGLPSGTKWRNQNEDHCETHNDALAVYKENIPSKQQWEELKEKCLWTWLGNGYYVTGPNGTSIFFPAEGLENGKGDKDFVGSRGYYVTSTPFNMKSSYTFNFNAEDIYINIGGNDDNKLSIRFIKKD